MVVVEHVDRLELLCGAAAPSSAHVYDLVGGADQLAAQVRHVRAVARPGAEVGVPGAREEHEVPVDRVELDVEVVAAAVAGSRFAGADVRQVPVRDVALAPARAHGVLFQRNLYVRFLFFFIDSFKALKFFNFYLVKLVIVLNSKFLKIFEISLYIVDHFKKYFPSKSRKLTKGLFLSVKSTDKTRSSSA